MTQEEIQEFERVCRESGINIIKEQHVLRNDDLFKLYRNIKRLNKQTKVFVIPKHLHDNDKLVLETIHENKKITNKELSIKTDLTLRRVQQSTKNLYEEKLITKENNDMPFVWTIK